MPLDPVLAGLLATLEQAGNPPLNEGTPAQGRAAFVALNGMLAAAFPDGPRIPVGTVRDETVPGPAGEITVRVYEPAGRSGAVPTVVMIHGGGFVICDLDTHDEQARLICAGTGAVVVSLDYRLAPEHPFPAAVEDCLAATRHVLANLDAYGGAGQKVGIGGDSAGGNLSAVVCQQLRDPGLAAQLLLYPAVDATDATDPYPSRTQNGTGYFLTEDDMHWFIGHYAGDQDRSDPRLSPLLAQDLTGLPPAVVCTAEFDPLRDEGEAYAAALEKAGVQVTATRYDGLIHGFAGMGAVSPACDTAIKAVVAQFAPLLR